MTQYIMSNVIDTLFSTLSPSLIFLLAKIMVGLTLYKWISLKVMGHTMISSNKRMSVEEYVEKRVPETFLIFYQTIYITSLLTNYEISRFVP
jgi:hypothetical protein